MPGREAGDGPFTDPSADPTSRRPVQTLSVVAPTYNEAANVEPLISALQTVLHGMDYEIIISDDDSPDRTWAKAEEAGRRDGRIRVLRRTANRGLSAAVVDGFSIARGEALACIDADLQHDPGILPQMLQALLNGSDLVVGSRYIPGGSTGTWGLLRRIGSWGATKLAQILVGVRLHDPMSGYFMLRRQDFRLIGEDLNGNGFKILLEIAAKLKNGRVTEVPYTFRPRTAGTSKVSRKVVLAYIQQLWRLSFLNRIFPAQFIKFGIVGTSGVVANLAVLAAILHFTSYRDWRASLVATLTATVSNYILNNFWTFRDRAHSGIKFLSRYRHYLLASLVGVAVTTVTYAAIAWVLGRVLGGGASELHSLVLLLSQLIAIFAGMFSNYSLNLKITWPETDPPYDSR